MPWGRLDDTLYDHPKLDELGAQRLPAIGLWTLAISWCNRRLTDGHVPAARIRQLGGSVALANRLVEAGLFERTDDGYLVHDFLEFNDSRAEVEARRDAEREKKRRQRSAGHAAVERNGKGQWESRGMSQGDAHRDTTGDDHRDPPRESPATRPGPSESRPIEGRKADSAGSRTGARSSSPSSGPRLTTAQLESWRSFDGPEWAAFRAAWLERGFLFAPGGSPDDDDTSQRGLLWQVADAWPTAIGQWVREAPGRTPKEVIDHVLHRFHERRDDVADDESDDERVRRGHAPSQLGEVLQRVSDERGWERPARDGAA